MNQSSITGVFKRFFQKDSVLYISGILSCVCLWICSIIYISNTGGSTVQDVRDQYSDAISHFFRGLTVFLAMISFRYHAKNLQKAFLGGLVCCAALNDFVWSATLPNRIFVQPIFWTILDIPFCICTMLVAILYFVLISDHESKPVTLFVMQLSIVILTVLYLVYAVLELQAGAIGFVFEDLGEPLGFIFLATICTKINIFKYDRSQFLNS